MSPSPNPQNPYAPPAQTAQQLLAAIPKYRRNGVCSALLLVALVAAFVGPVALHSAGLAGSGIFDVVLGIPLLTVCVIVLTGEVYFDQLEPNGQLKKWGAGNKLVAALILLGWGSSIVKAFL